MSQFIDPVCIVEPVRAIAQPVLQAIATWYRLAGMRALLPTIAPPTIARGYRYGPSRAKYVALVLLAGCDAQEHRVAPQVNAGPSAAPAVFKDMAETAGLRFDHVAGVSGEWFLPEIVGAGAAILDFDGDGDLDVYLVQGGGRVDALPAPLSNRLLRNDLTPSGKLQFVDVTAAAGVGDNGYGMGAAAADYDNDGDTDLYVTNVGTNVLYRNDGNGRFTNVTQAAGVDDPRWSASAAFVDIDNDGLLDLFVTNYVADSITGNKRCETTAGVRDYCSPVSFAGTTDSLFHNLGDGRFANISVPSGVSTAAAAGLGVVAADFDGDGLTDIFVANDQSANFLWRNQGGLTFVDQGLISGSAYNGHGMAEASMGVTAGDFDGDGDDDLFMTHFSSQTNTLYQNDGRGNFTDVTDRLRLGAVSLAFTGFASRWFDYDNDSLLDLFIANGSVLALASRVQHSSYPYEERNQLFRNTGERFEEVIGTVNDPLQRLRVSRGAAFGDLDNDGDIDILVTNNNGPAELLINQAGSDQAWLMVQLRGGQANRDGLGARVAVLRPQHPPLWRRAATDGSYLSANDARVHFGLGQYHQTVAVGVIWSGGKRERWDDLPLREIVQLTQGQGQPWPVSTGALGGSGT